MNAKQEWQTIDTAPEGEEIILHGKKWGGDFITMVGQIEKIRGSRYINPIGADGYNVEPSLDRENVTHWMPLPQPPTT